MNNNEKLALDSFGRKAVEEILDRSCEYLQGVISHGMHGERPDPLHEAYQSLDERSKAILRQFLWDAVDQTFAQCLQFLDVHSVPLLVTTKSGEVVDVRNLSDGLPGEPYGEEGWLQRFSKFKDGISPVSRD